MWDLAPLPEGCNSCGMETVSGGGCRSFVSDLEGVFVTAVMDGVTEG